MWGEYNLKDYVTFGSGVKYGNGYISAYFAWWWPDLVAGAALRGGREYPFVLERLAIGRLRHLNTAWLRKPCAEKFETLASELENATLTTRRLVGELSLTVLLCGVEVGFEARLYRRGGRLLVFARSDVLPVPSLLAEYAIEKASGRVHAQGNA